MADIVIHGMDVPKLCCECPLKESMYDVGYICLPRKEPIKVNLYKGIDDACPLLPLSEGHGRLGDLDALLEKMYHLSDNEGTHKDSCVDDSLILRDSACYLIDDAPTIVPAEGGER